LGIRNSGCGIRFEGSGFGVDGFGVSTNLAPVMSTLINIDEGVESRLIRGSNPIYYAITDFAKRKQSYGIDAEFYKKLRSRIGVTGFLSGWYRQAPHPQVANNFAVDW